MADLLSDPNLPIYGAGVVALLLAVLAAKRAGGKKKGGKQHSLPGMEKLLREGRYVEAGQLAIKHERHEEAIDYFLRGQEPGRAANVAARIGQAKKAAELFELAGNADRAAFYYNQAGMDQKARELQAKLPAPRAASRAPSKAPEKELDSKFQAAKSAATGGQVVDRAKAQQLGREAAEAHLAAGNIKGAADTYKDAELYDEAIHLYVNVLGLPGEAAPLVASRGNHQRAAELYELAGLKERAAGLWVDLARGSKSPESFVERISRLSEKHAYQLLEEQTASRPLAKSTIELHYLWGLALAKQGQAPRASQIFSGIREKFGEYKDVSEQIRELAAGPKYPANEPVIHILAPEPAFVGNIDLDDRTLTQMNMEAALAARDEARRQQVMGNAMNGLDDTLLSGSAEAMRARVPNGENAKPAASAALASLPEQLVDIVVHMARGGPSIDTLLRFIAGRPCDLQNIEVYYRLGIAYLAAGKYGEAANAFEAVEEASPGYRDAIARAAEVRAWKSAVGGTITDVGVEGSAVKPKEKMRYVLSGELGRGGMAVVYRAQDQVLGRDVALKFLADQYTADKNVRDMFEREARSVAQLNHPNIVTIYDFGLLERRAFIAMEYVDGVTVKDMVGEGRRLSVIDALRIIVQLLGALEYAHGRNIIHRDIKPSNIMRTPSGLVKLMDFGLAKSIARESRASIVAGTPAYMAPEQMFGEDMDARTDLFAVGVTLYEMLAGVLPFERFDRAKPPKKLREVRASIPSVLDELVSRALAMEPKDRFQSAKTFAAPLQKIIDRASQLAAGDLKSQDLPKIEVMPQVPYAKKS